MASTLDLALFALAPVVAVLVVMLDRILQSVDEVKEDWPKYRCNPLYMPFASLIQSEVSTADNFTFCMSLMGKQVTKAPIDAVQGMMGTVLNTFKGLISKLDVFRGLWPKLAGFMMMMINMVLGKLTGVISSMSFNLQKIMDVVKRMVGTGVIGMFMMRTLFLTLVAFWNVAISVIRGFIYTMLAISFALALFNPILLGITIAILAVFGSAGGFSTL